MKIKYRFEIYILLFIIFLLVIRHVLLNKQILESFTGTAALTLATRNAIEIRWNRLRTLLLKKIEKLDQENIRINSENIDENKKQIKLNRNHIERNKNMIEINRSDIEMNKTNIEEMKKLIAWNRKEINEIKKLLGENYIDNIKKIKKGTCDAEKNAFMFSECTDTPDRPECGEYRRSPYKCKAFPDVKL